MKKPNLQDIIFSPPFIKLPEDRERILGRSNVRMRVKKAGRSYSEEFQDPQSKIGGRTETTT